jgi:hypothetical protein
MGIAEVTLSAGGEQRGRPVKVVCPKCRAETNGPDELHLDPKYKLKCPMIHKHIVLVKRGAGGTKMDCPHMRRAIMMAALETV